MFRRKTKSKSKKTMEEPIEEVEEGEVNVITREQDEAREHGPLEATLLDFFESVDEEKDGKMTFEEFGTVFEHLGVSLDDEHLRDLFNKVDADHDGRISYDEFVPKAKEALRAKLESLHEGDEAEWVEFYSRAEGILYFNTVTGEAQYELPPSYAGSEDELVADAFIAHFMLRDPENTQVVDLEVFLSDLQTDQLGLFLSSEEVEAIIEAHPPEETNPSTVNYMTLGPLIRNYITQLYAGRSEHPGNWARLISNHYGTIWFNKLSGVVQQDVPIDVLVAAQSAPGGIVPNIVKGTSVSDARRASELQVELETLREAVENGDAGVGGKGVDQETFKQTNKEMKSLQDENDELKEKLSEAERRLKLADDEKDAMKNLAEGEVDVEDLLKAKLKLESELSAASKTREKLEGMVASVKSDNAVLQAEIDALKKTLNATQSDRDRGVREISQLKSKLKATKTQVSGVAELQANITDLQNKLKDARVLNEERSKNLNSARAQLKNIKERMNVAESDIEQMEDLRHQLHDQREEARTTKSFLASKTRVIQQKNDEIKKLKEKVNQLEAQDEKRSKILQNLLEKTTSLQAQISEPNPSLALETSARRIRSGSPNRQQAVLQQHNNTTSPMKRTSRIKPAKARRQRGQQGGAMFPPIHKNTALLNQKVIDDPLDHTTSEKDDVAACHVRVGDRVLVRGPVIDGVVKQFTGTVKYVGRLDNDVIDYNLYVGLKMDDTIGDTDGIFKGKRYFKCSERFGRFVPLSDIMSVVMSRAPRKRGGNRREQHIKA
eukprot:m.66020 g.66020  ORF g.66020 m.66020 type:complete len:779 (+) comp11546_c0_seq4:82-2418(+)